MEEPDHRSGKRDHRPDAPSAGPRVSIAIIRDGALAWCRGFGIKDIRTKQPVDEQTVFEAASTSKPLFAYAVMKLCERGVIDLDSLSRNTHPSDFSRVTRAST